LSSFFSLLFVVLYSLFLNVLFVWLQNSCILQELAICITFYFCEFFSFFFNVFYLIMCFVVCLLL
jgi:hypothetical protein